MWFLFQIAIMTWLERRVSLGAQGRPLCRGVSRRFRGQLVISQTRKAARVSGGFACPSKRHCRSINSPSSCRWSSFAALVASFS